MHWNLSPSNDYFSCLYFDGKQIFFHQRNTHRQRTNVLWITKSFKNKKNDPLKKHLLTASFPRPNILETFKVLRGTRSTTACSRVRCFFNLTTWEITSVKRQHFEHLTVYKKRFKEKYNPLCECASIKSPYSYVGVHAAPRKPWTRRVKKIRFNRSLKFEFWKIK